MGLSALASSVGVVILSRVRLPERATFAISYVGRDGGVPRKLRELRADLRRAGFAVDHQTGSHQVWKHALLHGMRANLAGSNGADARAYQEREVREALRKLAEAEERDRP